MPSITTRARTTALTATGPRPTRVRCSYAARAGGGPLPKYPPTRLRDGRTLISRAEQTARTGMSPQRLSALYAERAHNGMPEPVDRVNRVLYWDETEWTAWHDAYQLAKRTRLSPVDTTGDPDDLVTAAEAARILGYSSHKTIHAYLRAHPGYFPDPDTTEELPSGRTRRFWLRRTIWAFAHSRDIRGGARPEGTGPTPQPLYSQHPLLPATRRALHNDPQISTKTLAEHLTIPEYTARRLLTAARDYT